jgi:hypothetical protein
VVEVFSPVRSRVTADAASANGLPACTVGAVFAAEPVPTDVEVRRFGHLVVSLLPGGPEDDSLGARGRVMLVHPHHGRTRLLARGILGATNVAVGRGGRVYVTELFGNRVSVIRDGHARTVARLHEPAAIEYGRSRLYVSIDVFGNGSVVTLGR